MGEWQPGAGVTVRVPASSANLGPGFDSVGVALGLWDRCRATVLADHALEITVSGEGAGSVPTDATHLVHRSLVHAFEELGEKPPSGLRLECDNEVPHGRGLGSSATAIVTGVALAHALRALRDGRPVEGLDLTPVNDLAARLEGHPDNSSASVYGGVTLSWSDDPERGTTTLRLAPHPDVVPVVFTPEVQLSTATARAVLPAQVRLSDAAANSARAALLVHAVTRAPEHLLDGTREWLHQEPRRASYPASMALVDELRAAGHAAVISGAGPSVLVLSTRGTADEVTTAGGAAWRVRRPGIPGRGVEFAVSETP
ncbi:homoserine kinase [Knoellia aerolata DSM 18566]|uniref:Homoserine kinase n=1 Tax=Knoellia aerolata DSM 18566 TaxID=1385519 RepID=A0A0A0JVT5_9MICO|nr:homoserine kinase [Knoellia aerolata]KGN41308.1 homoserine kinase [Knoellia aerolata DSM 18566]